MPLIEAGRPDLLQFHGKETPEHVAAIKARFGLPVIKSIAIKTLDDLNQCANWDGVADWLLFDSKVEAGTQPGGTGQSFDDSDRDFVLCRDAGKWNLDVGGIERAIFVKLEGYRSQTGDGVVKGDDECSTVANAAQTPSFDRNLQR